MIKHLYCNHFNFRFIFFFYYSLFTLCYYHPVHHNMFRIKNKIEIANFVKHSISVTKCLSSFNSDAISVMSSIVAIFAASQPMLKDTFPKIGISLTKSIGSFSDNVGPNSTYVSRVQNITGIFNSEHY